MGQVLPIANERPALSLDLPEGLSFEEWVDVGRRLCIGRQAVNWHIGDWWAFGDHRYGQRAKAAAEKLFPGKEFQTLMNLASVARAYEPSRRREVLSFTHHAEVAALANQEPDAAECLLAKAEEEGWSKNDLRREVQARKASNDRGIGAVEAPHQEPARPPLPEFTRQDLVYAMTMVLELAEAVEQYRGLMPREADGKARAISFLGLTGEASKPVPDDFRINFREHGRIECERIYGASRLTVNLWLVQSGKRALIDERAAFVKHQRSLAKSQMPLHADDKPSTIDTLLPVARMAAQHIRTSRYGRWPVSMREGGGWFVGTAVKTSEELIGMAERQGFDRHAAQVEADREGY